MQSFVSIVYAMGFGLWCVIIFKSKMEVIGKIFSGILSKLFVYLGYAVNIKLLLPFQPNVDVDENPIKMDKSKSSVDMTKLKAVRTKSAALLSY